METEGTGKAKGGYARAAKLTPEVRKKIAQKAAKERWGEPRIPKATHVGEIHIGNKILPCAVLEDGTRVLTQEGFLKAIGRSGKPAAGRGSVVEKIAPFLALDNLKPFINDELVSSTMPVRFIPLKGSKAFGYKAELLPKVCDVYLKARDGNALLQSQLKFAQACDILMRGLAHVGIVALVDEATGYQDIRPQDALQKYLEMIIRKELATWAKKFPDEFYENIYKLKGWPWPGMKKKRFSIVAHYTRDLVYERIAPGLLQELEKKSPKDETGNRKNKLHQWLTEDIGDPMLSQHLHSLVMFQRLAIANGYGWNRFVKMVDKVLPRRGANLELPLNLDPDPIEL